MEPRSCVTAVGITEEVHLIEIDYIFNAARVRDACSSGTIAMDHSLPEWEMLVRLQADHVEVLGRTDTEHQSWMDQLKHDNSALSVPSADWSLLEIISVAVSIDSALQQLHTMGRAALEGIEQADITLEYRGDDVLIAFRHDRVGRASATDLTEGVS